MGLRVTEAGFFLGTSVHDTAQAMASSMIYDEVWSSRTATGLSCADIAITTELVRNTFMIVVIPFLGYWFRRRTAKEGTGTGIKVMKYLPLFVLGYVAMGVVRTLGDRFIGADNAVWVSTWQTVKVIAGYLITVALASVGLNTNLRKLSVLGHKPFVCGLVAALSVGLVSWLLVWLFGGYLAF